MLLVREQQAAQALAGEENAHVLAPAFGYLSRLKRRMELTGFRRDGPLFILTRDAQAKMHNLLVELHYLSCEGGVGRAPERDA